MQTPVSQQQMSEQPIEYTGGCFCGYVRYRALEKPIEVTHCHCSICRRVSGAPFVTWATFAKTNFSWTNSKPSRFHSSSKAERTFCDRCGTALTFEEIKRSELIDVTVGSMDQPNNFSPQEHVWTSSRLSWLHLSDGLPEYLQ
ncbi:MAG: GFA family protein [Coleofasciculus sp. S288]|nr:GFA family protein [Coleofasciculus sp. S288]